MTTHPIHRNNHHGPFAVALIKIIGCELIFFLAGFLLGIFWLLILMLIAPAVGTYYARRNASDYITKRALITALILLGLAQFVAEYRSSPSDLSAQPFSLIMPVIMIVILGYAVGLVGMHFGAMRPGKGLAK